MNLRKTKYIFGIAGIAVAGAIVVASNLPKSLQYYVTVDELQARQREYMGKELKVAGKVAAGSIAKTEGSMEMAFGVENAGARILVHYHGAVPDTFKEGVDVVVTGTLDRPGEFTANHLLAKCASRYEEKLQAGYNSPARKEP